MDSAGGFVGIKTPKLSKATSFAGHLRVSIVPLFNKLPCLFAHEVQHEVLVGVSLRMSAMRAKNEMHEKNHMTCVLHGLSF